MKTKKIINVENINLGDVIEIHDSDGFWLTKVIRKEKDEFGKISFETEHDGNLYDLDDIHGHWIRQ